MRSDSKRVFLGWEGPLLAQAATWLAEHRGPDMRGVIVAVPGGRAGRRLRELLARSIGPGWRPPRILTQGQLTDELVRLDRPVAGRLARTLAWERALRSLPPAELAKLLPEPPAESDAGEWTRLAETVRALHGELAPEGLDFRSVAEGSARPESAGEAARWEALAVAQDAYRSGLSELGLADPHEARFAAIRAGAVDKDARIVLVGVADMNRLLRLALEASPGRTTALVFAPESEAESFDMWGCLVTARWKDRDATLAAEDWYVADKPVDQARLATDIIGSWDAKWAAEEVTIGVADEDVTPYLERRLAAFGVRARHAAGVPLARTRPYRLLEATAEFLRGRRFADYAALVRHPDLEARLSAAEGLGDPAAILDGYFAVHLPDGVSGFWPGTDENTAAMRALSEAFEGALAGLLEQTPRSLGEWARRILDYLAGVYGALELDTDVEAQRVLHDALEALAEALREIEELPAALASGPCAAAGAIDLALRELRSKTVPPTPPSAGEPTIELLGWLELPLDDAPGLVVTGFTDGCVPQSLQGDAFLPDGLRKQLGLADNDARLARDLYALTVLCASRRVAFVSGRRSSVGDALVPSRLVFRCPESETPARVETFLGVAQSLRAAPVLDAGEESFVRPRHAAEREIESISVTAFSTYLESPYLFYLRHVLRLKSVEDGARELDPMQFGIFAHEVLHAFGLSAAKDALDAGTIDAVLQDELRRLAELRYGRDPMPAVAMQIEQLAYRLHLFAERQAEWANEGWRILEVEWAPDDGWVPFTVDGEDIRLTGRIDRIDKHMRTGRIAILDYKTGESAKDPVAAHYSKRLDVWRDLQLPLYCQLALPLELEELPLLGYVAVGRDPANVQFRLAEDWTEDDIANATEAARDVVRCIRRGEFEDIGRRVPTEPAVRALCGLGLLAGEDDGEAGEDAP